MGMCMHSRSGVIEADPAAMDFSDIFEAMIAVKRCLEHDGANIPPGLGMENFDKGDSR